MKYSVIIFISLFMFSCNDYRETNTDNKYKYYHCCCETLESKRNRVALWVCGEYPYYRGECKPIRGINKCKTRRHKR